MLKLVPLAGTWWPQPGASGAGRRGRRAATEPPRAAAGAQGTAAGG